MNYWEHALKTKPLANSAKSKQLRRVDATAEEIQEQIEKIVKSIYRKGSIYNGKVDELEEDQFTSIGFVTIEVKSWRWRKPRKFGELLEEEENLGPTTHRNCKGQIQKYQRTTVTSLNELMRQIECGTDRKIKNVPQPELGRAGTSGPGRRLSPSEPSSGWRASR
ncbi:hypothetical protein EVAR_88896_1 [Eumeta japonica]|uniref:Uncharacterized protein n=1 Tax=Eumeta variegata TaxID=151549 RepID=A0A4C1XYR4_EUMVA|nr:hypothetical protein EVAR_88896_1 [Eumeta japonica]